MRVCQEYDERRHSAQLFGSESIGDQSIREQVTQVRFVNRLNQMSARGVVQDATVTGSLHGDDKPTDNQPTVSPAMPNATPPESPGRRLRRLSSPHDQRVTLMQTQCMKVALAIFGRQEPRPRSLGFVSAIGGEGKTFVAATTAIAMANQAHRPVTLIDCNWDHRSLHGMFDIPESPGLAEWLRRECALRQIRYKVNDSLTVIPAGDAMSDPVKLVDLLRTTGPHSLLNEPGEVAMFDLPPVLTTVYAAQLARSLDASLMVVRARVTWDSYVAQACQELEGAALEGLVLNGTYSKLPRWLQRLL